MHSEQQKTTSKSRLSLIVAMAKNRVIGADGKIPWHLPNELQLFKSVTMGHHIIMGRKTWESINRLLPGRTTVIVTRQHDFKVPGALVVHTLEQAIAQCAGDSEVFIIGGGELYRAAMPLADRIYLTVVDAEPVGDTRMPEFDPTQWRVHSTQNYDKDDRHAHDYRFEIHDRVTV
ncbi:MAG: dihydrofolate reductase [Burkholderiales bacterium]|nr:dihydrofolate reductase [Burkholderiales bacterium]